VKRVLGVVAAVAALSGCAGGDGEGAPTEDPAQAMRRVIRHELAGRLGRSWSLLVQEQRDIVDRELYVRCPNGQPIDDARISILGVRDQTYAVPAIGRTETKAVRWRMTVPQPGGEPITLSRTGHLVAQDGSWRWTLSEQSFRLYRAGVCP
jgi:hypothetical protein